jgi:hypothetical protein
MGGKHPIPIINDQCRSMGSAIPDILSNACHRCCSFHVIESIDDKGGSIFQANEGLYEELHDMIDNSLTVHELETLWQAMITNLDVGNVKIFEDL